MVDTDRSSPVIQGAIIPGSSRQPGDRSEPVLYHTNCAGGVDIDDIETYAIEPQPLGFGIGQPDPGQGTQTSAFPPVNGIEPGSVHRGAPGLDLGENQHRPGAGTIEHNQIDLTPTTPPVPGQDLGPRAFIMLGGRVLSKAAEPLIVAQRSRSGSSSTVMPRVLDIVTRLRKRDCR